MGKAHVDCVGDQPFGHLIPGQEPVIGIALPGAGVHFVDRHRHAARINLCPMRAVGRIAPIRFSGLRGDRGGLGAEFSRKGKGICFERQDSAVGGHDMEFIGAAQTNIGDEDFPHAHIIAAAHRVAAGIPIIKVTHQCDKPRIGGPHGEVNAIRALMLDEMRAHLVEQPQMGALIDQEIIDRPQHGAKAIGVCHPPFMPIGAAAIFDGFGLAPDLAFKHRRVIDTVQTAKRCSAKRERTDLICTGQDGARKAAVRPLMHTQ